MEKIEFSQEELKILFAVLTQEKFQLGDLAILFPIAKKIQDHIQPDKKAEEKLDLKAAPVEPKN